MTFEELNLKPELQEAIGYMGYSTLTEIQEKTYHPILEGRDVLGLASTGSGKSLAFCLPLCQRLLDKGAYEGVLILSPTWELSIQTANQLHGLIYFTPLHAETIYGGNDSGAFDREKRALEAKVQFIVATPGRLLAHMRNAYADMSYFRYLVLDEADKMLDMGFYDDIKQIIKRLPAERQNLLFSATMSPRIRKLANEILRNPVEVSIAVAKPATGIQQQVVLVQEETKSKYLSHFLKKLKPEEQAIVFCGKKKLLQSLVNRLNNKGIRAAYISSELEQAEREAVLTAFKSKQYKALVATDVLARGIDIADLAAVVNYDVPPSPDDYVHRIGRTARHNKTGLAITLISPLEMSKFSFIEKKLGIEVPKVSAGNEFGESFEWNPNFGKKQKKRPLKKPSTPPKPQVKANRKPPRKSSSAPKQAE
ncbi:RNA helicase [Thermaurantimonas aggregans]|uniref:RNA helicase n=1 Tax=Thermaurantimonas aggregans TaxID=2173829 RepID=A0A401XI32_9FLAO|nr:DEAD/DEAH box helicase [Thermaurantimonas aggregans]GCD76677.1 RNA helicase [Thermaurantimonas aggregans]